MKIIIIMITTALINDYDEDENDVDEKENEEKEEDYEEDTSFRLSEKEYGWIEKTLICTRVQALC